MHILDLKNQKIEIIALKEEKNRLVFEKYQQLYNYLERLNESQYQFLLTIILPVFNEEKTVYSVLENLPKNPLIEIIVVDDNSTDNSIKKIEEIKKIRHLKLIKHEKNKGYGGAIITGMKAARGNVIITMDSDGQHSPLDILSLIKPVFEGEADLTIGSRYLGSSNYDIPLVTRLGEAFMEKIIHLLFNVRIMNNQNGFRALNRRIIRLAFKAKYQDFTFPTELILRTRLKGYMIKECPIKLYHRQFGASKVNLSRLTLNLFACILLYFMKKLELFFFKKIGYKNKN